MANWLRHLGLKASRAAAPNPEQRPPIALITGWTTRLGVRSYDRLVCDAYMRNPIAQRAVKLVSEAAGAAPLVAAEAGQRLADHPALSLLWSPNPMQCGPLFFETLAAQLLLHGNCYVERVDGPDGFPAELHALRPDRVSILPGESGWPAAYRYAVGNNRVDFTVDPLTGSSAVLHVKALHPLDDQYGLSPLDAVATAVDTHSAASAWNLTLLENAARPSGALVFEPAGGEASLSADQFQRLRQQLEESFQGGGNAGRPLLLEGGLRWQPLSLSPADMDFVAAKATAAREIALGFGVPPMLLGLPGDNTYANYQEANRAFWRLTVLPLLAKLTAAFSVWLARDWPGLTIDVDRDAIPALAADRERLWRQVAQAEFLTADEKRRILGLGPAAT